MRKNQITISVMELVKGKPLEYTVYCDDNNFCDALIGATQMVVEEHMSRQEIPTTGDKSITYKEPIGRYMGIPVVKGDVLTAPTDVIIHQVNCMGRMGSGVAQQVRERFPNVYDAYLKFCDRYKDKNQLLGQVLCVDTGDGRTICNMFSQLNFGYDGKMYTNIEAFKQCLEYINDRFDGKTVAIPYKIGCCRGGANWDDISVLISRELSNCKVTLYMYNK